MARKLASYWWFQYLLSKLLNSIQIMIQGSRKSHQIKRYQTIAKNEIKISMIVQVKAFNMGDWLDGALACGLTARVGAVAVESDGLLGEAVGECDGLIGEVFEFESL